MSILGGILLAVGIFIVLSFMYLLVIAIAPGFKVPGQPLNRVKHEAKRPQEKPLSTEGGKIRLDNVKGGIFEGKYSGLFWKSWEESGSAEPDIFDREGASGKHKSRQYSR